MGALGLRTQGWQTNAARLAAFQRRDRRTPKNPTSITAVEDGIKISFSVKLDRELAEIPARGRSIVDRVGPHVRLSRSLASTRC